MLDPAPITRYLRAKASAHLLVAAIHHFRVFEVISQQAFSMAALQQTMHLKERPAMVLFPALCAMGLLEFNKENKLQITALGEFLTSSNQFNLIGYTGLEKDDPGVIKMAEWLINDGPANSAECVSYVKDEAAPSPMDEPEAARFFTLALAGRAKFLSPVVAAALPKHKGLLLDVAGGTGYYEWLLANPTSHAIVFDRPEVLKVASSLLNDFCSSGSSGADTIKERLTFLPGDMLTDELPVADIVLAASVFHDWNTATCQMLATKFATALKRGGELWIHDSFLNDTLDGPVAVTDYSAMLFLGTRGRAYSRKEYRSWLSYAGLLPSSHNISTLMDYGLISAKKPV